MADDEAKASLEKNSKINLEEMEVDDEEDEFFEVERILAKSKLKGAVSYKVRWKGFGPEEDTWEPIENLDSCKELIEEFDRKRDESIKQKAEERKMRQAKMEGRSSSQESSEEDITSPYPPNFKNCFWKDLEAGRIDVFDSNMYSKVKERSVKQQSLKEYQSKEQEVEAKKKPNVETKSERVSTPKNANKLSKSLSQRGSKSSSSSSSRNKKSNSSKSKKTASLKFEKINTISIESDCDSDTDFSFTPISGKDENEDPLVVGNTEKAVVERPGIKLIMKLPKPPVVEAMVTTKDSQCSLKSSSQSTGRRELADKHESWETTKKKKKKHHKHRDSDLVSLHTEQKHKHHEHKDKPKHSEHKHRPITPSINDKMESCPATVKVESFPSTFKIESESSPEIEKVESSPGFEDIKDVKKELNLTLDDCSMDWTEPSFSDSVYSTTDSVSFHTPLTSASKTDSSFDLNHTCGSLVTQNYNTISHSYTTPSHNYTSHSTSTPSHNFTTSRDNGTLMLCTNANPISNTFEDFPLPLLDCNLNTSANTCVTRRDSETVDSGIASPASEKSLGLSRSELYNPLDDVLDQSILPFFPDSGNVPERAADHDFSIDLDEIDWELFDREVKLEPITLSNDEFVKAVMTGDYGLVKRAFMGTGKYSLEHADQSGKTLLIHAAQHGYDDIADLLIEHGANVNTQMTNGFTPLMTACQFAELCTVNLLIELGAKVNMQTYNGESALMIAVRRGHKHITWLLLESGANFSLKSHAGYTALSYARAFNHIDTESVISTHAQRLMAEFDRQVSFTLNNLANLREMVFPPQVFNISEDEVFSVNFNYTSQLPTIHGLGYLLFLGHAVFTNEEVKCRFYGPCAVKKACLNGVSLSPLTQEGNFVLAFNPVVSGNNVLTVNAVKEMDMKGKLIVCAYKAQLV